MIDQLKSVPIFLVASIFHLSLNEFCMGVLHFTTNHFTTNHINIKLPFMFGGVLLQHYCYYSPLSLLNSTLYMAVAIQDTLAKTTTVNERCPTVPST